MELNENPMNYRTGSTTWTADVSFELDLAEKLDLDFVRISMSPRGARRVFVRSGKVSFPLSWISMSPMVNT